jgi:hypothetical protein
MGTVSMSERRRICPSQVSRMSLATAQPLVLLNDPT